ncbi:hypothetical protein ACLQ2Y_32495, partial [Micromonospora echinospora]
HVWSSPSCDVSASCGGAAVLVVEGVKKGAQAALTVRPRLGFGGKLCVHPRQIAPADEALRPTATERAWARRVIESTFSAEAVVLVDGRMVDRPVIARARRILDLPSEGAGS